MEPESRSPLEHVKHALTEGYSDFGGRAGRAEYWWFQAFALVAGLLAMAPAVILDVGPLLVLSLVVWLALLLPGMAVLVRRLHDTGRTGWLFLVVVIPFVGSIMLLVFLLQESSPRANQWGPSAKR